jgi:hypothetical protein
LYVCTSKASKLGTWRPPETGQRRGPPNEAQQYLYFCTSKASKHTSKASKLKVPGGRQKLGRGAARVSICTFVRVKQVNLVPGGRQTLGRGAARRTRRSPRCSSMQLLPSVSAQFTCCIGAFLVPQYTRRSRRCSSMQLLPLPGVSAQFTCCIGAFLVPQYNHSSASTLVRSMLNLLAV